MAVAILEDHEWWNIESVPDFFKANYGSWSPEPLYEFRCKEKYKAPDVSRIGCNWHKRFLSRHPAFKPVYSRALDDNCAMNNNPGTITEYFNVLKSTVEEFKTSLRISTTWIRRDS